MPEMEISMSFSLKCDEQIVGQTRVLNFLSARLQKTSHFLHSSGLEGNKKLPRSILSAKSNCTILDHGTHRNILQRTKNTLRFLTNYQKHMAFLSMFAFIILRRIPLSLASVLEFRHQSLTLKYIEIGLFGTRLTEKL